MNRRGFLAFAGTLAVLLGSDPAGAETAAGEFRIGYQKNGVLLVAKQQKLIEKRLAALGISVTWVEFSFGPPLLEALNSGNIDFGTTGDAPPIFAQTAKANLLSVAASPAPDQALQSWYRRDHPFILSQIYGARRLVLRKHRACII